LPPNIFDPLLSLEKLFLEENLIKDLPLNIFSSLKNMHTFYLYSNKLEVIHAFPFGKLPLLKLVNVRDNKIFAIDEKFINNTGISKIHMLNNICADKLIEDLTLTRYVLKAELQKCFDYYKRTFG
jgi:Leucine-rich repeat (LRR) protein